MQAVVAKAAPLTSLDPNRGYTDQHGIAGPWMPIGPPPPPLATSRKHGASARPSSTAAASGASSSTVKSLQDLWWRIALRWWRSRTKVRFWTVQEHRHSPLERAAVLRRELCQQHHRRQYLAYWLWSPVLLQGMAARGMMSAANNNRPPVKLRWMQPCGSKSGPPNCRTSTRQAGFQSCCAGRGAARSWLLHQADDEATTTEANSGDGGSTTRNTNSIPHQQGPRELRQGLLQQQDRRQAELYKCQEGSILQAGPLVKRSSMVQQCTMPQPSASKNGADSSHASIGGEPRQYRMSPEEGEP